MQQKPSILQWRIKLCAQYLWKFQKRGKWTEERKTVGEYRIDSEFKRQELNEQMRANIWNVK